MSLITRNEKGSALTYNELDGNFIYLNTVRWVHLKIENDSATQTLVQGIANAKLVEWNIQTHIDEIFVHKQGQSNITITEDGVYSIMANIAWDATVDSARDSAVVYLVVNGTPVESTSSIGYSRGNIYGDYHHNTVNTLLELSANDEVEIGYYGENVDGGSNLKLEWCEFIIKHEGTVSI